MSAEANRAVHEAVQRFLDEGEIAVSWCLTIDVAGPDERRYLYNRAGGGADGNDAPMMWAAAGMLQASVDVARDQMRDARIGPEEDED